MKKYCISVCLLLLASSSVLTAQTLSLAENGLWTEDLVESKVTARCTRIVQSETSNRSALVVGNGAYNPGIDWLDAAYNDAIGIASVLLNLGFNIYLATEADKPTILSCLNQIEALDSRDEINLFFYSGHGVQVGDENYIIPVDASANNLNENDLISIDGIMQSLRERAETTLVFLDACRSTPEVWANQVREGLSISLGNPGTVDDFPRNEFVVAYATQPGNVASAGIGRYSPFTKAIIEEIGQPNHSIQETLARITAKVGSASGWEQHPFTRTTLSRLLVLREAVNTVDLIEAAKVAATEADSLLSLGQREAALERILKVLPKNVPNAETGNFSEALRQLRRAVYGRWIVLQDDDPFDFALASPDNSVLLTHSWNTNGPDVTRLWDINTGSLLSEFHDEFLVAADRLPAFSSDGKTLALMATPEELAFISVGEKPVVRKVKLRTLSENSQFWYGKVHFSPDDQHVAVNAWGYDDVLWVVSVESGRVVYSLSKTAPQPAITFNGVIPSRNRTLTYTSPVNFAFSGPRTLCIATNLLPSDDGNSKSSETRLTYFGTLDWSANALDFDLIVQDGSVGDSVLDCRENGERLFKAYLSPHLRSGDEIPTSLIYTKENETYELDFIRSDWLGSAIFSPDGQAAYLSTVPRVILDLQTLEVAKDLSTQENVEIDLDLGRILSKDGRQMGEVWPDFDVWPEHRKSFYFDPEKTTDELIESGLSHLRPNVRVEVSDARPDWPSER